ncbi:MAG TPA: DUF1707 domain-containing protein [Candidatus Avipropionibacterium avicola]|uniref:DUF1707 domain-containing protein n=1 Tax=Candidatus Avipropionibacterium avicola TaxID=2840701 RepID=A0A9D1GZ62_9ACTN|nr:DUF1707 domain-containing protein [Candidatus Avipropionibacterium avicola]
MSTQDQPARRLRAGHDDRGRVLDAIQRAHDDGRLTDDELSERRNRAARAVYVDELPELLDDLPEYEGWQQLPPTNNALVVPADPTLDAAGARTPVPRREALPATAEPDAGFSVTVMSGRDVALEPGTTDLANFAWWGGNNYDLTRAMGPGRTVTLSLSAVMAGSDIRVPSGVRVIDRSIAIMAGNEVSAGAQGDGSNGTLILKGFLWWAGNTVELADGE